MLDILKTIWDETTGSANGVTRFRPFNWSMFLFFFASVVVIITCEIIESRGYLPYRGWYYMAPLSFLMLSFIGPVIHIARHERDRGVRVVLFWGLIGLIAFIITFIAAFAAFIPDSQTQGASGTSMYDRLLNIVPATIAIWAAVLGWYTHHQITMKAHRTTHAFNLIMQTRTNAQYIHSLRTFQLLYPVGVSMPAGPEDIDFYRSDAIKQLPSLEAIRDNPATLAQERADAMVKICKIEAAIAAKYLLNFYEFMARGIRSGDLDSGILYDTIGSTVVSIYKRAAAYREQHRESQPLAMQFLKQLAEDWERRKRQDVGNTPW